MKPSEKLFNWLANQVKTGDFKPLPPDHLLADQFCVSQSTVKRIIKKFQITGEIKRISGKGSYITGEAPQEKIQEFLQKNSSPRRFAASLEKLISSGKLQPGQNLPPVKLSSIENQITPATVTKAYRYLESKGMVHKTGRQYRVGGTKFRLDSDLKRPVYFFAWGDKSFNEIIQKDWLHHAYLRMERELVSNGYILYYRNFSEFSKLSRVWGQEQSYPFGIIIAFLKKTKLDEVLHSLKKIIKKSSLHPIKFLLVGENQKNIPAFVHYVSRGNLITNLSRALAEFIVQKNFQKVVFFCRNFEKDSLQFIRFLKLRQEIKRINPHILTNFSIISGTPHQDVVSGLYKHHQSEKITGIINKYQSVELETVIKNELMEKNSIHASFQKEKIPTLWVFTTDENALQAKQWLKQNHIKIPNQQSIISLENHSGNLLEGLSSIVIDLESLGNFMARALIGDHPIQRSGKGYLRVPPLLLERETTP